MDALAACSWAEIATYERDLRGDPVEDGTDWDALDKDAMDAAWQKAQVT